MEMPKQYIIFQKVEWTDPSLKTYAVVDSNKPRPPGSNHYILAFWEVAYRRFNCVLQNIIQQMISVKFKKILQLTMP